MKSTRLQRKKKIDSFPKKADFWIVLLTPFAFEKLTWSIKCSLSCVCFSPAAPSRFLLGKGERFIFSPRHPGTITLSSVPSCCHRGAEPTNSEWDVACNGIFDGGNPFSLFPGGQHFKFMESHFWGQGNFAFQPLLKSQNLKRVPLQIVTVVLSCCMQLFDLFVLNWAQILISCGSFRIFGKWLRKSVLIPTQNQHWNKIPRRRRNSPVENGVQLGVDVGVNSPQSAHALQITSDCTRAFMNTRHWLRTASMFHVACRRRRRWWRRDN